MKNALYHAATSATIQFPDNPIRGNGDDLGRPQVSAQDSDGIYYAYTRGKIRTVDRSLVYTNVPYLTVEALSVFLQSRNGDRVHFVFYDHDSASHTVKFKASKLDYLETTPGKYRVSFSITEEL
jgi:hypothetical protein